MCEEVGHKAYDELTLVVEDAAKHIDEKMVGVNEMLRGLRTSHTNLTEDQSIAESDALKKPVEAIERLIKQLEGVKTSMKDVSLDFLREVTHRPGGARKTRPTVNGADSGVYSSDSRVFSANGPLVTHPTDEMRTMRSPNFAETPKQQVHDKTE